MGHEKNHRLLDISLGEAIRSAIIALNMKPVFTSDRINIREDTPSAITHEMSHTVQKQIKFEQLVSQWSTDLYRFAYWLCKDKVLSEDLVQETFIRAWKAIDQLQDPNAVKSWLFTILRREHARQFERKVIPIAQEREPDTMVSHQAQDTSTEAFVLRQALDELAPEYREPLILQVIGGYSMDEIAEQLDLSKGAVMTRLFRARNRLRSQLETTTP